MKENFGLYLIATEPIASYKTLALAAVECEVRYLQLRMKNVSRKTLLQTAHLYRKITKGTATRFIMNDDLSVAIESDADGIHLGQTDLSISEARQRWNTPGKLFGLSTHNLEQAARAEILRPDYIGIGPVFPTPTKADAAPALGPEETGRIAQAVALTAVAIGGITIDNLPALRTAGIDNFCVVSAVNAQADPAAAIRRLQNA